MSSPNSQTSTAAKQDTWSADQYNAVASFVYSKEFTTPVFSLLNAQPGERILDLGCGSGELTIELAKIVGERGVVIGVDASVSMIAKARQNGAKASYVADAQALQFPPPPTEVNEISSAIPANFDYKFDAVFSNAALHWCKRSPAGVLEGVSRALRPGGRFAAECGGYTNIIGLRAAMHAVLKRRGYDPVARDPWFFPSVEGYKKLLENAGFKVEQIALHPRLTPLKTDIVDWQRTFCRDSIYAGLSDAEAQDVMQEVQDMCAIDSKDASGHWAIMYTRLRFVVSKLCT